MKLSYENNKKKDAATLQPRSAWK